MRPKRRILLASAFLVLALFIAVLIWPSNEPSYNGKSLRQWLEEYYQSGQSSIEASNAVAYIGTNAIPVLLRLAATRNSATRLFIVKNFPYLRPSWLGFNNQLFWYGNEIRNSPELANGGFQILGPAASNAVPTLARILRNGAKTEKILSTPHPGAIALGNIGPAARAALPVLIEYLDHAEGNESSTTTYESRVKPICSIARDTDGKIDRESLQLLLPALADGVNGINGKNQTGTNNGSIILAFTLLGTTNGDQVVSEIESFQNSTNSKVAALARSILESITNHTAQSTNK